MRYQPGASVQWGAGWQLRPDHQSAIGIEPEAVHRYAPPPRRSGGIGRRAGFKIRSSQEGVGSSPTSGTSLNDLATIARQGALPTQNRRETCNRASPLRSHHSPEQPACSQLCVSRGPPSLSRRLHPSPPGGARQRCENPTVGAALLDASPRIGLPSLQRVNSLSCSRVTLVGNDSHVRRGSLVDA